MVNVSQAAGCIHQRLDQECQSPGILAVLRYESSSTLGSKHVSCSRPKAAQKGASSLFTVSQAQSEVRRDSERHVMYQLPT